MDDSAKAYEMIDVLECKVAKAEADALDVYNVSKTESDTLKDSNIALQTKIKECEREIDDLKRVNGNAFEASNRLDKDLNDYKLKFSTEKAGLKKEHKEEVKALKKSIGEANQEKTKMHKQFKNKLSEEIAVKDAEVRKVSNEKVELEEKVNSLLDTLYGCNYCGCHGCTLECEEYEEFLAAENVNDENVEDENSEDYGQETPEQSKPRVLTSQPAREIRVTSVTPLHPPPPQPSSCTPPWTPPPTPPCSRCGADNYGPCPGSVCFKCIPNSSPTISSPSTTPPRTPPLLRRCHQSHSLLGNMPVGDSEQ